MKNKYSCELLSFNEKFSKYKTKKMVLYGIGRMTATLVPYAISEGYNIIGLMDKESDNVLSFDELVYKKKADDFLNEHGVLADGRTSERVATIVCEKLK